MRFHMTVVIYANINVLNNVQFVNKENVSLVKEAYIII